MTIDRWTARGARSGEASSLLPKLHGSQLSYLSNCGVERILNLSTDGRENWKLILDIKKQPQAAWFDQCRQQN